MIDIRRSLDQAEKSLRSAQTFRFHGAGKDAGHSISFDMHFGDNGSDGTLTLDGYPVRLREIGSTLYVNGSARFWRHAVAAAGANSSEAADAVQIYAGLWGQTTTSSKGFAEMTAFSDRKKLLTDAPGVHGKFVSGGTKTIRGVRATGIVDTSDHSVLWVRAAGTPVPVEITDPGKGREEVSAVNVPFHVPAPPADQIVMLPS